MAASTHHDQRREEEKDQDQDQASASAFSLRSSSWYNDNPSHQSQWLQTTLSDLDKKIKAMLNIMQDDGDTFVKRAEMYYKRRPELVEMVEDLQKSYRSLAENYDKLKSESPGSGAGHQKLLSSFNKAQQLLQNCLVEETDEPTCYPESDLGKETSNELDSNMKESDSVDGKEVNIKRINFGDEFSVLEREKMRNEMKLKVSELLEDNLREQKELIKRNDEKKQVIKELGSQINKLMDENRALRTSLAHSSNNNIKNEVDSQHKQVRAPRFRKLFCIKF